MGQGGYNGNKWIGTAYDLNWSTIYAIISYDFHKSTTENGHRLLVVKIRLFWQFFSVLSHQNFFFTLACTQRGQMLLPPALVLLCFLFCEPFFQSLFLHIFQIVTMDLVSWSVNTIDQIFSTIRQGEWPLAPIEYKQRDARWIPGGSRSLCVSWYCWSRTLKMCTKLDLW